MQIINKKFKVFFVLAAVFVVVCFFVFLLSRGYIYPRTQLVYGVTFSAKQARALGLDWQKVYLALLDDLGVRHLRLSAYWDETEPQRGQFSWQELDWQIEQAERRGAKIILATGARLPRWPECHLPEWTKNLSTSERQAETLNYIKKVVKRYRNAKTITAWQVENEPFLAYFGECPPLDKNFLDKEIALVRSLDKKPIVITDSGELSLWVPAAKRADIFGTTMYRDTYSQHLRAYVHYPIEPGFFRFKKNITRLFARPQKWVVIEMQAEPWGPKPFQELSKEERSRTMNLKKFKEMIEFARRTGFQEFYLWGVEWWYWEKETQDNPALWQEAKKIFNQ